MLKFLCVSVAVLIAALIMSEDNLGSERQCSWNKFSEKKLISLEKKILEVVKTAYKAWFVNIGNTVGTDDKIWTIALNEESKNTPLVLLHGFAAGLGFWVLNFDELAKHRPVYAIDLLGFGRSSRPTFDKDHMEAEKQLVQSIEEWRKQVNLDEFILLGHSFGGFLATSYAINYPQHVKHLILADPWGFNEKPADFNPPFLLRTLAFFLTNFNPLATVRAAGPMGPWLVRKARSDIAEKYGGSLEDKEIITEYIYHCNSQKPTGESAFHSMLKDYAFPKNPMIHRIQDLHKEIPMSVIYGADSWVDKSSGAKIKEQRSESFVQLQVVSNAGHHIHADEPESFNKLVIEACFLSDMTESRKNIVNENSNETCKIDNEDLNLGITVS